MKKYSKKSLSQVMGASLLATLAVLPQARGELVYEDDAKAMNENSHSVKIDDRTSMREAIGASQKMQVAMETSAPVSVSDASAAEPETQSVYKHELMRRERQREEVKNEDILQERLEALRLRDEKRRMDEMFAGEKGSEKSQAAANASVVMMKEEVVVAPVTEHPGMPSQAPVAVVSPMTMSAGPVDSMSMSQAQVSTTMIDDERARLSIVPRAGFSNIVNQAGYFDVRPRYSAGFAARVSANDNFSLELGYQFNEYGVAMATNNPWVLAQRAQSMYYGTPVNPESVAMKQNVLDAGLKIHLLGVDSKIRPFLGGGGAYSKSFINFDPTVLSLMNAAYGRNVSQDYEVSGFLGYVASGLDVKVAKSISVGAEFKYYAVLSARETSNFSNYYGAMYPNTGYYGAMPGSYGAAAATGTDTAVAGGSLSRSNFYSILGNVTFTF